MKLLLLHGDEIDEISNELNSQLIVENVSTPLAEKWNVESPSKTVIVTIVRYWELHRRVK